MTNNDECDQEWQKRSVNDKIQTDKMTKSDSINDVNDLNEIIIMNNLKNCQE